MNYNRHYTGEENPDAAALRDIVDYLSEKQWNIILEAAKDRKQHGPQELDMYLCCVGVQGFPNHAFIRTFRPDQYDEWYESLRD